MTALTSPYLWYTARATGTVALVLLTLTVVLGALVTTRVGGNAVGRFEVNEIHRAVSMIAVIFVAIHVVVTVIDTYVPIGLLSVVLPFTSSYRRLPVAIGTIAIDLMLAVWLTSLVKDRIRYRTWRAVHWVSWLSFAAAALHGFVTGTDAHQEWSLALTLSCVGAVALAALWRTTQRPERAAGRTAHSPIRSLAGAPSRPPERSPLPRGATPPRRPRAATDTVKPRVPPPAPRRSSAR